MELRVFVEPQQGATYDDQLAVARTAEAAGYDAFFRSDHYVAMNADGLPGPTDSWVTLGALARETSTIRLGTLVTSNTFRYPGPLAISVAQVDQMSGGRVDFGFGAGWFDDEHTAYGIPFPSVKERFDRFEEALAVITGLWETPSGETFSHDGQYYPIKDSPALPKPVQNPRPPIVIGGAGKKRTAKLAATYAQEFNVPFSSVEDSAQAFGRVNSACVELGRAPETLTRSVALVVAGGKSDAEVAARAKKIGREVDELKENGVAGSPTEMIDKLKLYSDIGVSRVYLQFLDMSDLDHIEFVSSEVLSQIGVL
ncbi:LLM class F420-dependent oxidoreductase [Gordonia jinhuaensis]|uniref:LLM class F420-dependent oxidoreductase n=1 Tax=Gordonia jinhuaensis TaxID=1517702 RepID=A0A916T4T9_9ACTN|nr:LLM class F420-dependent oxidoreductase [Gordonia jinhuaensis]GGB31902.1 LLM class F420-dependent oxidoreductase [Gordonia jinhuaensis]